MFVFITRVKISNVKYSLILITISIIGINYPSNAQDAINSYEHYVPAEKNLSKEWLEMIYTRGERKVYRGDELFTIGMPCGGIGAGQLYVRGDGTLARWWIFNDNYNTTFYQETTHEKGYKTYRPESDVNQGFAIQTKTKKGQVIKLPLSQEGFNDIGFIGEYPIATIMYEQPKENIPVDIELEVFSPFIPLDARNSAIPATIFSYKVTNSSKEEVDVKIDGWLENAILKKYNTQVKAKRYNSVYNNESFVAAYMNLVNSDGKNQISESIDLIEDFETTIVNADGTPGDLGSLINWNIEGDAFGDKAASIYQVQQGNDGELVWGFKGHEGSHFLFSQLNGIDKVGKAKRKVNITQNYISFLIAGKNSAHESKGGSCCVNLLVDGEVVRTATGEDNWKMSLVSWDVSNYRGQNATIEIIDTDENGALAVDYFRFSDDKLEKEHMFPVNHVGFGNMAIALLDNDGKANANWINQKGVNEHISSLNDEISGGVSKYFSLKPHESRTISFVISWYFPNYKNDSPGCPGNVGRMYSNWYNNSLDVVNYIADHYEMLYQSTHKYRDAMYLESTLPYWFVQRTAASSANLASASVEWWKNGRFYSFEGVGFCHGTCGHVWNYVQTVSRLFPELERSVRRMQDFNMDLAQKQSGRINFRGFYDNSESFMNWGYIPDAQAGYVLKAYREHLVSPDYSFLTELWPNIKLAMQYLIKRDGRYGETDGVLEGLQHLTDNLAWGPNTFTGSLYLASLRASETMALQMGDTTFADVCNKLYQNGSDWTLKNLWNGEYFIHKYSPAPAGVLPSELLTNSDSINYGNSYGNGCLSDQLFGQNWAHQLGLGYVYPEPKVKAALRSVYKYNWTPDVGTIYKVRNKRFIHLADVGEPGMVGLTYPYGEIPVNALHQNDDPWVGYEYQVASHMLREGLLTEGMSIAYGAHLRYDGKTNNPWNEIEGGDHYTRAMAAWGMLLGISGFEYDGPAGKIGFAPRLTPENFKCFYSAAEGWGSYSQKRFENTQECILKVEWGVLNLNEISLEMPLKAKIKNVLMQFNGTKKQVDFKQEESKVRVIVDGITINQGEEVKMHFQW
ncbi:GH116 family glycosyl hydrolase [Aestuariivivens sp. NBU2969]|uniref:GH116 family glycosyl hydrolase n=1 Tax=Aestuariivivens sp. NBU2969 TaxID=2873267 RepID=UPI001CBBA40C|nr:GH116 family glycosyl hydrolase [Aestuariivivens sp. NBU2969]